MPRGKRFDYTNLPNVQTLSQAEAREMVEAGASDTEVLDTFARAVSSEAEYLEDRVAIDDIPDEDRYAVALEKYNDDGSPVSVVKVDYVKLAYQHMSGMTIAQSAAYFGVHATRMGFIKRSPGFKAVLGLMSKSAVDTGRAFIAGAVAKATGVLINLLSSENDKVKLMAANSILDRAGLLPPDQMVMIERSTGVHGLSEDELVSIVHNAIKDVPRQIAGGDDESSDA